MDENIFNENISIGSRLFIILLFFIIKFSKMQTFGLKCLVDIILASDQYHLLAKLKRENRMGKYCNFIVLVKMRKSQPAQKPQVVGP